MDMTGRSQISVLMPCKDQRKDFLVASIKSVFCQTSPDWILYIIVDKETPERIKETILSYEPDPRVRMIKGEGKSLAGALNTGMEYARTEFICILLSDDLLHRDAITVLKGYIRTYPEIDFFHSKSLPGNIRVYKRRDLVVSSSPFPHTAEFVTVITVTAHHLFSPIGDVGGK